MNLNINVGNQRRPGFGGPGRCGGGNPMLRLMQQMLRLMQQMMGGCGARGGCPCQGGHGRHGTNININVGNQFRGFGF
jgi:hypothetical protein